MSEGRIRPSRTRGHWRRWLVAERAVRSDLVVMLPPPFDKHFSLLQRVEDLVTTRHSGDVDGDRAFFDSADDAGFLVALLVE